MNTDSKTQNKKSPLEQRQACRSKATAEAQGNMGYPHPPSISESHSRVSHVQPSH
jgi:hypothetical protein